MLEASKGGPVFWYVVGRWSGYRAATREKRGQCGCGTWFVLLILVGLSIEYWYVTVPVLAVLVVVLVTAARQRPVSSATRAAVTTPSPPRPTFYRSRCDWCGAPRAHGAQVCRYCGRSMVVG
jgi:hypothetical protein